MLKALKFVRGAVAKKDYQPALTHFRVADGRVLGYDGKIALCSSIDLDITASPKAEPFVRAIERCTNETTVLHLTPAGKLSVKSGRFKAFIDCAEDTSVLDSIQPEGEDVTFPGGVLAAFRVLERFIGEDASRSWSGGVLLKGQSAFATNNIIVAEYWLGVDLPEVNVPGAAVRELLRIGEEPSAAQISERNITFHFEEGRWMRAQLSVTDWPDVSRILDLPCDPVPWPEGIFEAVETLKPFVGEEGRVYMRGDHLTTSPEEGAGASVDLPGLPARAAFHHHYLSSLQGVAQLVDLSTHPQPCGFRGERLRGCILGMRDEA